MADFLIRGLDETTMRVLRERAERNGRSLQAEIKDTLKRSTMMTKEETLESMRKFAEEMRGRTFSKSSAELIREDRDER